MESVALCLWSSSPENFPACRDFRCACGIVQAARTNGNFRRQSRDGTSSAQGHSRKLQSLLWLRSKRTCLRRRKKQCRTATSRLPWRTKNAAELAKSPRSVPRSGLRPAFTVGWKTLQTRKRLVRRTKVQRKWRSSRLNREHLEEIDHAMNVRDESEVWKALGMTEWSVVILQDHIDQFD